MPRPLLIPLILVLVGGCQPAAPDSVVLAPIAAPVAAALAPTAVAPNAVGPNAVGRGGGGPPEPAPAQAWGRPFFCAPLRSLPDPPRYCTRSIGSVDCWTRAPLTLPARPGLADGRESLTPDQAAQRAQCWPGFL